MTQPVRTKLADGRELIYFDDAPGKHRELHDRRDLPHSEPDSEMRHDLIQDEWVVVSAHRQNRTYLPPSDECPLCPSHGDHLTEVPADDYDVVVFENRFPSLGFTNADREQRGMTEVLPAYGRCEVVCFTSDHTGRFASLPAERLRTVAAAWIHRTAELSEVENVEYVLCFENRGKEIGVTLEHPHGQIYAYPFVPPKVRQALDSARRWRDAHDGQCLFCMLRDDEAAQERVVHRNEHAVAYVPAAARWPFQVQVHPLRHVPDLAALTPDELAGMLAAQAEVLARFDGLFDRPMPYIWAWYQAPTKSDRDLSHLYLEVFSSRRTAEKLKYLAGSESAGGAFVTDVPPERAAALLREADPSPKPAEPAPDRE